MAALFRTMKSALFLILLVSLVNVQARKKKPKHHPVTQNKIFPGFRYPFFAIRVPLFGSEDEDEDRMKPSSLVFDDGKKGKLKTSTKTSNSTNGPFKTFTVTSVTTSGNKSNPQMFEKVIQSVTTLNKNDTDKNSTQPAFRETQFIFRPFGFFNRLKGQFDDESLKDCSPKKPCAGDQFCDKFFGVCKKRVGKGEACSQKDQCTSKSGNLQCTWGKCTVNSEVGGLGTFCDAQKDCKASSNGEELGCFLQPDISRFSKLCIAKLQEGATCGRRRLFDMFEDEIDEDSQLCRKNLVCRAVGFLGRKICQKADDSTDVNVQKVEKKSKKHRHHKH